MALELKPLTPNIGADASGLDLRRPLDAADIAAIDAALDRYAVLVFRDQPMSQEEQVACARQFGPLDAGLRKATGAATRFQHEELIDISNLALDGSLADRDNARLIGALANQLWHSDSSFQPLPIKYSMLSAVVVPDKAGRPNGRTCAPPGTLCRKTCGVKSRAAARGIRPFIRASCWATINTRRDS